ncbi:F-box domain-containing protein [Orpheovirus IHUMI-LCC2]|uniref:F-box domain-containing protein n=1 Tax=Orpheovirus IHUMI-LCC2 TaxID=2023057 RepID=A0A2I2L3N9_9VIRU|nr:F-box domain-containing protein [Orpheovirus IHUMI-LCC2]SNW62130.1 F-box domain-containing protein [Orpheovirus IHUMI-LCC2]
MDFVSHEIIYHILLYSDIEDMNNIRLVNKLYNIILSDDLYWKNKLYLHYNKDVKVLNNTWKEQYALADKMGYMVLDIPHSINIPPNNYTITLCDKYNIKGLILPYKAIYATYNSDIYYITDQYKLYKLLKSSDYQTSVFIDNNVTNIKYQNTRIIYYIKEEDIYEYIPLDNSSNRITYCSNVVDMYYYANITRINGIYFITKCGNCYKATKTEQWKIQHIAYIHNANKIIVKFDSVLILDSEGILTYIVNDKTLCRLEGVRIKDIFNVGKIIVKDINNVLYKLKFRYQLEGETNMTVLVIQCNKEHILKLNDIDEDVLRCRRYILSDSKKDAIISLYAVHGYGCKFTNISLDIKVKDICNKESYPAIFII